jgi:hypothetical protein
MCSRPRISKRAWSSFGSMLGNRNWSTAVTARFRNVRRARRRRSAFDRPGAVWVRLLSSVCRRSFCTAQATVPPTAARARAIGTGVTRSSAIAPLMTGADGIKARTTRPEARGQRPETTRFSSGRWPLAYGLVVKALSPISQWRIGPKLLHITAAGYGLDVCGPELPLPLLVGPQKIAPGSLGEASRPIAVWHCWPGTLLCVATAV